MQGLSEAVVQRRYSCTQDEGSGDEVLTGQDSNSQRLRRARGERGRGETLIGQPSVTFPFPAYHAFNRVVYPAED